MNGPAMVIGLPIFGLVVGVVLMGALGRGRHARVAAREEAEIWRRTTAEVVPSEFRTRDRRFIRVRYRVGNSLIENDVSYTLGGTTPPVGQVVFVRYDVAAPARVVLDAEGPRSRGAGVSSSGWAGPNG